MVNNAVCLFVRKSMRRRPRVTIASKYLFSFLKLSFAFCFVEAVLGLDALAWGRGETRGKSVRA
jgi:hypothetical protein